jgi:dTDP-4-dehydrorhamnose 3,5-epimerase-like enzyme
LAKWRRLPYQQEVSALRPQIKRLADTGDDRGSSYTPDHNWQTFLETIAELHITTVLPGKIRGNHVHLRKREILVVIHTDKWSFHWDEGLGTPAQQSVFEGTGAELIEVPPGCSHAVRNDGLAPLTVLGFCDRIYDPADPDAERRPLAAS